MTEIDFVKRMHKKLENLDDTKECSFLTDSGQIEGLNYWVHGCKLEDIIYMEGGFGEYKLSFKQRPGIIDFTCAGDRVIFEIDKIEKEHLYSVINSVLMTCASKTNTLRSIKQ